MVWSRFSRRHLPLAVVALCVLVACEGLNLNLGDDADVATTDSPDVETDAAVDVDDRPDITVDGPVTPVYDPEAARFFDAPWPSDDRLTEDGHIDLSGFPGNPSDVFDAYITEIEKLTGFSAAPVVYFDFEGPVGAIRFPTPTETLELGAPISMVRVDDGGCGERIPLVVEYVHIGDRWLRNTSLNVRPVPGFWLEPEGTYAALVRTTLGDADGVDVRASEAFTNRLAEAPHFESTRTCMETLGESLDDVAVGSTFTVQPLVGEMRRIRDQVRDASVVPRPAVRDWARQPDLTDASNLFDVYFANYETPIYQAGESPYRDDGGFVFDGEGTPQIQRWEEVPMSVMVPNAQTTGPRPVLIWVDGTGASRTFHLRRDVVRKAIAEGFVVVSFTPQMHEPRGPWEEADEILDSFNYLNPESGRTVFRQQAIDTVYLLRVIRESLASGGFDGLPALRTDRIVYGGHSQGAMVGAITAGIEDEIVAYVLNGVGGYLAVTVEERIDPIDVAGLMALYLGVKESEVRVSHPFVQLAQTGADAVDPQSFARYWAGGPGNPAGTSVLMTNGMQDHTTFPRSMNSLTIYGDAPVIEPMGWDPDPYGVWPETSMTLPVQGNRASIGGNALTMGTLYDQSEGHFALHNIPEWQDIAVNFWVTALEGTPVLARP